MFMACKDCEPGSKRPTPHPGPRCATHNRARTKALSAANHEKRVQAVYGLPPGDYARLLAFQGGACAITLKASQVRRLAVDHDHDTGEVRGLLTRKANRDLLGFFSRDDLQRAIDYLDDPPYRRMLRGDADAAGSGTDTV